MSMFCRDSYGGGGEGGSFVNGQRERAVMGNYSRRKTKALWVGVQAVFLTGVTHTDAAAFGAGPLLCSSSD